MAPREAGKKLTVWGFVRARFVTGVLVGLPLVITLFFGRLLFNLFDRWADPIMVAAFGRTVPGVGAGVAIVFIFLLGVLAHNVIGSKILQMGDNLMTRVPVLRPIYRGAREVTRALGADRSRQFRRVVLAPFPYPGCWSVAFVTGEFERAGTGGTERLVTVYMPTTPNPTTGFFIVYPLDQLRETGLSVEEAIRMVISGGLVMPHPDQFLDATGPSPKP